MMGAFFFILGILGIVLPWAPKLRQSTAQFFLDNTLILSLFGLGLLLIGLSIIIYALLNTRKRYLFIRTGKQSVAINKMILQQYLEAYWQQNFPSHQVCFEVNIKKEAIQIIAELPFIPTSEQKDFLEQVKQDLGTLFGQTLGYEKDVHLFASFAPANVI
jgi:hypothetical protein